MYAERPLCDGADFQQREELIGTAETPQLGNLRGTTSLSTW